MSGFLISHSLASNPSLRFSLLISPDETFKAVENYNIKNQEWQPTYYQNPGGIFSRLFNLWSWNYKNDWQLTLRQALFFEKKKTDFLAQTMLADVFTSPRLLFTQKSKVGAKQDTRHHPPPWFPGLPPPTKPTDDTMFPVKETHCPRPWHSKSTATEDLLYFCVRRSSFSYENYYQKKSHHLK